MLGNLALAFAASSGLMVVLTSGATAGGPLALIFVKKDQEKNAENGKGGTRGNQCFQQCVDSLEDGSD